MKSKSLLFKFVLLIFLSSNMQTLCAQAPQKMSYQAVIRNTSNTLVVSSPVGMKISILQGSASGSSVYTETQTTSTNANGLVSLEIGTGIVVSGNFATINWATGPYFIKTEVDPLGGTSYTIVGTSQLMSVPYALFAAGSGNGEAPGSAVGDMKYWNGTAWTMIPVGTPGQFLQLSSSNIPSWTGGTFAALTLNPIPNQVSSFSPGESVSGNLSSTGLTSSGGSPNVQIGFCWNTSPNPTVADNQAIFYQYAGTGNFTGSVFSLLPSTTYYVRAFAINSAGTSYSNQQSFTTFTPTIPTLTTTAVSNVTGGTADGGGTVTNDGNALVSARGVCWSTSPNPTLADSFTSNGFGTGIFSSTINGLVISTTYYLRAYATNVAGTAYGNQVTFTTTSTLSIGSFHQGGLIGYLLQSGDPGYSSTIPHGIIISQNNVAGGVIWGCQGTLISGANSTVIGGGAQNTLDIIAGCSIPGIAAALCDNLVLNGYTDWFLPSDNEWIALSSPAAITSNVVVNQQGYWTSNQYNANNANILFNNYPNYSGAIINIGKDDFNAYGGVVRAIRMF